MASPIRYVLPLVVCLSWASPAERPASTSADDQTASHAKIDSPVAAWYWLQHIPSRPLDEPGECSMSSAHYHLIAAGEAPPEVDCPPPTAGTPDPADLDCILESTADPTAAYSPLPVMLWVVSHCDDIDFVVAAQLGRDAGPEGAALVRIEALSPANGDAEAAAPPDGGDAPEFESASQEEPTTKADDDEDADDDAKDEDEPVGVDNDNDPPTSGPTYASLGDDEQGDGGLRIYTVQVPSGDARLPAGNYVVTVLLHRDDDVRCLHLDGIMPVSEEGQ